MKKKHFSSSSNKSNALLEALEMEEEKTKKMEDTIKRIDEEMKRSDDLLAQMIPPAVAEKVKSGFNPVDTCEVSYTFQSRSQPTKIFQMCNGCRYSSLLPSYSTTFRPLSTSRKSVMV